MYHVINLLHVLPLKKILSRWTLLNWSSNQSFKKSMLKFYLWHQCKHIFIALYGEIGFLGTFTHYLLQVSLWGKDTKADNVIKTIITSGNWPSWENYFLSSVKKCQEFSEPGVLWWAIWQEKNRQWWRKRQTVTISLSHFWSSLTGD